MSDRVNGSDDDADPAESRSAGSHADPVAAPSGLPPLEEMARGRRVRRPRYRMFVASGVAVGLFLAGLLLVVGPGGEGGRVLLLYLVLTLGILGALIGGGLAVLIDRRSGRPSPPGDGRSPAPSGQG